MENNFCAIFIHYFACAMSFLVAPKTLLENWSPRGLELFPEEVDTPKPEELLTERYVGKYVKRDANHGGTVGDSDELDEERRRTRRKRR